MVGETTRIQKALKTILEFNSGAKVDERDPL